MSPCTPETLLPIAFTASSSSFWRRPVMKTYAPSLTNSFAVANPIPSVPPVMRAILSLSFLNIPFLRCCRVVTNSHAPMRFVPVLSPSGTIQCAEQTALGIGTAHHDCCRGTELTHLASGDEAMFLGHCPVNGYWMIMRPFGRISFPCCCASIAGDFEIDERPNGCRATSEYSRRYLRRTSCKDRAKRSRYAALPVRCPASGSGETEAAAQGRIRRSPRRRFPCSSTR